MTGMEISLILQQEKGYAGSCGNAQPSEQPGQAGPVHGQQHRNQSRSVDQQHQLPLSTLYHIHIGQGEAVGQLH